MKNKSVLKMSFPGVLPKISRPVGKSIDSKESRNLLKPAHQQAKYGSSRNDSNSIYQPDLVQERSISSVTPLSMNTRVCNEIWAEHFEPRVQAKPFGVPNLRTVLYVKHWQVGRVELLTEVSTTTNDKLYIVVFQRYLKPKKSGQGNEEQDDRNDFDDIKVKEMWQVEAIQLLKRHDNDLRTFV